MAIHFAVWACEADPAGRRSSGDHFGGARVAVRIQLDRRGGRHIRRRLWQLRGRWLRRQHHHTARLVLNQYCPVWIHPTFACRQRRNADQGESNDHERGVALTERHQLLPCSSRSDHVPQWVSQRFIWRTSQSNVNPQELQAWIAGSQVRPVGHRGAVIGGHVVGSNVAAPRWLNRDGPPESSPSGH